MTADNIRSASIPPTTHVPVHLYETVKQKAENAEAWIEHLEAQAEKQWKNHQVAVVAVLAAVAGFVAGLIL